MTFADDQYEAARSFAYTMIVVDDEPIGAGMEAEPVVKVKTPGRGDVTTAKVTTGEPVSPELHSLKTKELIKSALELGLVCSIVNPKGDEDNVAKSVAKAALRADIVSLDWQMNNNDNGLLASEIIKEILCKDEEIGGRLRLIAIYTGDTDKQGILDNIAARLNATTEITSPVVKKDDELANSSGLRVIWRRKSLGNDKLADAVSEVQLPDELLKAFAKLSNGLLANVALSTISAMRDSTHHLLSKFSQELDGPFFHHRTLLENSSESMDYAVSIVMSAMKSEVDKSQISKRYATKEAIKRRLEVAGKDTFILRYEHEGSEKQFHFSLDEVLTIIEGSNRDKWPPEILTAAKARNENKNNTKPQNSYLKSDFSTLFSESRDAANQSMMRFSFLSSSNLSELSKVSRTVLPKLGLGSVLHSEQSGYLLCLQASCDAARGDGLFFFVPLNIVKSSPHVVVPHLGANGEPNYIGLEVPENCYTKSLTINFGKIDSAIGGISISFDGDRKIFCVNSNAKIEYRWLANLKYKRALRISQDVSQHMSRIGFDEFEPFRKKRP
ncbi:response regulator receiver domain [Cypionkella sp.]|uniref:response regulator receiver domain n=1 Tax=Cypionkella sp. TaxID=2811411 RepID=UPI00271A727E|nr:response regulator receiver domain [Cypionkella sp.]MDO8986007.1 response regulator receiver domain [Cypionkella sp.]MDP2048195.1 response regulator receiver domain [Cypionkella sp.]